MKRLLIFMIISAFMLTTSCSGDSDGKKGGESIFPDPDESKGDEKDEIREFAEFYELLPDTLNLVIKSSKHFLAMYRNEDSYSSSNKMICEGLKNDNYWFGLFDILNEIDSQYRYYYDWTDPLNEEEPKTIDKGYGDISTHTFLSKSLYSFWQLSKESFSFIIESKYTHDQSFSKLIFSNSSEEKIIDFDDRITSIYCWFEDNIIVNHGINSLYTEWDCYSESGSYQFSFLTNPYEYSPVSLSKGLRAVFKAKGIYPEYTYHYELSVFDFLEDIESFSILTDELPDGDRTRYDGLSLTKKDGIIWYCSLNFTLYSGAKLTYEFSINTETGELTKL